MAKLFDAEGNEVEALTTEEFEAKKAEIISETTAGFKTKETEFQSKVEELTKQLEEAGLSEPQKKRLKEQKEIAETALKEVTESFKKEINDLKSSIFSGHRSKLIQAVAKDDETREKISAKADSLMKTGDYTQDEAGISKAVADAATLITGARPAPNFMDNISGAGERGNTQQYQGGKDESAASKEQRKVLGISDKDVEEFGPKPAN